MENWLNKNFHKIDFNIAKFFHNIEVHCGKLSTFSAKFISLLGKAGLVIILISLILCIFTKTRKMGATILFAIAISAIITGLILKPLVDRARPYTHTELKYFNWWKNAGSVFEESASFPSGHTTVAMSFALSVFMCSKHKKISWLIFLFPILMASSRIYLMVHYFSDCLFGLISGAIGAILGYFITHLLFNKTKGKFNNFINNFSLFNKSKERKTNDKNNLDTYSNNDKT